MSALSQTAEEVPGGDGRGRVEGSSMMAAHRTLCIWLLLALLGLAPTFAGTPPVTRHFPLNFRWEGIDVRVPNGEITPDQRTILVHAFLTSPQSVNSVSWQTLFTLVNRKGEELRPSSDCGVDSGNGMVITMGSFPLPAEREVRLLIYFPIHADELPVHLRLPDDSETVPITP
jgi:hypothetical protein